MLNRQQEVVLPRLCRLIGPPFGGDLSDRALLERFLGQRDAAAFAALVRRHGPTVLGVCRRILNNTHDAEDAFQATFLVLVRKGRSIAKREALGSWLYGVAYRVALKARADAVRRRHHERQAARRSEEQSPPDGTRDDLRDVIDEEVNRLSDKYRRPVVLCYFEGKTYQEAARLLGWPAGTVSVRLARARELLRTRLALRGLALSAGALAAWLVEGTASTADACLLAEATANAAVRFAADPAAAGVSSQVIALTQGVVKAMFLRKLKTVAGVLLTVGMTCGGAGVLWHFAVTAPASAADRPRETLGAGTGPSAGEGLVASNPPTGAGAAGAAPPAAADPFGQAPETPAGPPPRALASPAGEGARPLQTRIGLINLTRVLKGSKKHQSVQAGLRAKMDQVKQKLDALKIQLDKYQADCDDPATPAGRRDESARQVHQLKREMEAEQERARGTLNKMSGDALGTMYREVEDIANRIAKRDGLELVMFYTDAVTEADFYNPDAVQRKLTQPGALMPMIVAPGMDITDAVIDGLNRMHPAPDGPRP
jgi:RNA polymerase sigma factor (sigma-70 family)